MGSDPIANKKNSATFYPVTSEEANKALKLQEEAERAEIKRFRALSPEQQQAELHQERAYYARQGRRYHRHFVLGFGPERRTAPPPAETDQKASSDQEQRSRIRSEWLDGLKLRTGMSDLDVAKAGGPAYNTIRKWRSGAKSSRDPYNRGRFAHVFGCEPQEVPE